MKLIFSIALLMFGFQLKAQVEPSVTFDTETGNYIIEYEGYIGEDENPVLIQRIFEPSTKIDPYVSAKVVKLLDSNYYAYQYDITNGDSSLQRLYNFYIEVFSTISEISVPDESWHSGFFSYLPIFHWYNSKGEAGLAHPLDGIASDSTERGFSYMSFGLPAIIQAYLAGNETITLSFPNEPPVEVSELLKPLRKFPNNTVIKNTIGPKDIDTPFIALNFLDTLLNYNQRSFELGWITNQTTADKYDSLFTQAKTLLEGNHIPWVDSTLHTVLAEVNEDSSGNITSEAYALLRYNTEYLIENLPDVIPPVLNLMSPSMGFPAGAFPNYDLITVTLTGELFNDSSKVYFNGNQKVTTVLSDSVITFPLLSYDIIVTNEYPVWVSNYGSNSDTLYFSIVDTLSQPVTPVLNCVRNNGGGSFTAFFGYNNSNSNGVYIAPGSKNYFSPNPSYRNQPKVFLTGLQSNVFSVDFDGDNLTWYLDGNSVTANKKSTACP